MLAIFDVEGVLYDAEYLPILAEKVTQFVIYTTRKTIFFTMEPELTIQRKMKIVSQIKRITANL